MEQEKKVKEKKYEEWWMENRLNWRAWGSWFSWGSPVGLSLGWALFIIPLGIFLLLIHMAGILK